MTALFESLSLMIIHDVLSLLILTYLLFSQIGKPILDTRLTKEHRQSKEIMIKFKQNLITK